MAKNIQIKFPRYIDRPRLIWVFEQDSVLYTSVISLSIAGICFLLSHSTTMFWFSLIFFVPYVAYIVAELKKTEGSRGGVSMALYIAGFGRNIPKGKKLEAYPDLKRMSELDFMPLGNENVFLS